MNSYNSNTFKYSNYTYTVDVTLYTVAGSPKDGISISLDAADIEEVVYESKLNDLMVKGHVIYTDKYAMVDKLLSQHYSYCDIMFAQNKKDSDNGAGMANFDKDKRFMHTFIISNIKVLAREMSIIKYEIDLMSLHWTKCAANIAFSNYGSTPQPVFDILKSCFSYNNLAIDTESFKRVKAPVTLNYITQQNDNMFSVANYLMHKLYYAPLMKDDSMKFIVYDQRKDTYGLLDLKDSQTFIGSYSTILSFFKTNNEALIQQEPTNIGSFESPMEKQMVYSDLFDKVMYSYDYNYNSIVGNLTQSKSIVNYLNRRIDNDSYQAKYLPMSQFPDMKHEYVGMYWDNKFDVYNKSVAALEENNSLILNITGDVRRQPGSLNNLMLDRSLANVTSDDKKELEKLKRKYKAYEGIWLASKVRTIIKPMQPSFRQLVVLFRNFVPQPEKTSS